MNLSIYRQLRKEGVRSRWASIVARHFPSGWTLKTRTDLNKHGRFPFDSDDPDFDHCRGLTTFGEKLIECVPVIDRTTLCILLHECAHVNLCHYMPQFWYGPGVYSEEMAFCEYEAETYAMNVLRVCGVGVPRSYLIRARYYVDWCICQDPDVQQTDEVLKFAYGRKWREFI